MQTGILGITENVLILNTEEDAWSFLERAQKRDFVFPDDIFIGDWCNLSIYLQGQEWNSSLTPSIFPVFNEFQKSVYHAYAEAKYDNKNQKLKKEEKKALEVIIKVSPGSTDTDTKPNLTEIAKACIDKMDGKQTLIAIVSIALIWGGNVYYKDFLQSKRDIRLIEISNEDKKNMLEAFHVMSEEETGRIKILTDIISTNLFLQNVDKDAAILQKQMLNSATKADHSEINGVALKQDLAKELMRTSRDEPEPKQINGIFQVLNLDWDTPHQITLKRLNDGVIVKATFDLRWLSAEAKEIIKNTEWKEDGVKRLKAKINARIIKDRIVNADLVEVENDDTAGN